jgi:hypothetical protein
MSIGPNIKKVKRQINKINSYGRGPCDWREFMRVQDGVRQSPTNGGWRSTQSGARLGSQQAPGNVLLPAACTGLPKDSVANVSQLVSVDRAVLGERVGKLPAAKLGLVLAGIDIVLGR